MATMYERLQNATKLERDRFMAIPLVSMLVAEPVESAPPSAGDAAEIGRIYIRFLVDSYYHVRAAAKVYALAATRVSTKDEEVRQWLLEHAFEEYGHHKWIEDDLKAMKYDVSRLDTAKPSVACDCLVAYMYYIAGHENPMGTIGDTYVIEGLSQMFATQLAGNIKGLLGVPDSAVSYLAKHGAADQGHMNEVRDLINTHVRREEDYDSIVQVSKVEFALYGQIVEHAASEGA
jgi:pyrroloquinoline quinone (PQQ) biosynthesis protein C